ncbi:MAG: protein-disulfide reductase DsbD family protein [candidate division Zixibacteria bacterium]|jgi:thiol:disulfide interchange protein DsbD|nr:protein-disulfide reductase DsbD family protein [candidate division Zixibacteria bacterium]
MIFQSLSGLFAPSLRLSNGVIAASLVVLLIAAGAVNLRGEPIRVGHVRAELISETESIQPGRPFWTGLRLVMDEHWHVYWRNPGDAGLPPTISWNLPDGFVSGPIQWPYPERFETGPLTSYGYHGEILLPVLITPPADLQAGREVTLRATVDWLVCREACIPGGAELSLTIPVDRQTPHVNASVAESFNHTRALLPVDLPDWGISGTVDDSLITISLRPPQWYNDSLADVYFYPFEKGIIYNAGQQVLRRTSTNYELSVPRFRNSTSAPERITGILFTESGWRGSGSEKAIIVDSPVGSPPATAAAKSESGGVWRALVFAFLGGIILNLMPCVLPVLSLKVLGFVNKAGNSTRSAFGHGLVFSAGVLVSFWILAGALLILRAGGENLGWGFQLQSPVFLVVLSSFIFLFALSLLGVFEIGTSLTSVATVGKSGGWTGSFLNGVTATVVATPCTAPFMGSALGFSLSQPGWVAMLVFTALAVGMASPYLILSASPRLLKFLPRPGRWMETFKQVMGFVLLATVIWLVWVLGLQAGANATAVLMLALLLIGVGGWVFGRWGTIAVPMPRRGVAYLSSALLLVGGLAVGLTGVSRFAVTPSRSQLVEMGEDFVWEPYTPERYRQAVESGTPVFIDFTAAWCLSCQVNEKVALDVEEVQRTFAEKGVVTLKADWTSRDDSITQALARYGRNSVPLYVLYEGNGKTEPRILPEIITPGIVLEALAAIKIKG